VTASTLVAHWKFSPFFFAEHLPSNRLDDSNLNGKRQRTALTVEHANEWERFGKACDT